MEKYEPPFVETNEVLNSVSEIMEMIGRIGALDNLSRFPTLRICEKDTIRHAVPGYI